MTIARMTEFLKSFLSPPLPARERDVLIVDGYAMEEDEGADPPCGTGCGGCGCG